MVFCPVLAVFMLVTTVVSAFRKFGPTTIATRQCTAFANLYEYNNIENRSKAKSKEASGSGAMILSEEVAQGLLRRCAENNDVDSVDLTTSLPFTINGKVFGQVLLPFAEKLSKYKDVFQVDSSGVSLVAALDDASPETRTKAVQRVTMALREEGVLTGWR